MTSTRPCRRPEHNHNRLARWQEVLASSGKKFKVHSSKRYAGRIIWKPGSKEERGNGSGSENAREIFLGMDGDDKAYLTFYYRIEYAHQVLRTLLFRPAAPRTVHPSDGTAHHHFTTAANRLLTGR